MRTTTEKATRPIYNKYVSKTFNLDSVTSTTQKSTLVEDPLFTEYKISSTTQTSTILEDKKSDNNAIFTEDLDYETDFISQLNPQGMLL